MDQQGSVLTSGRSLDAAGIFLVVITLAVFLLPILIFFPPTAPSPSDALVQTHSWVGLEPSESRLGSGSDSAPTFGPARIRSLFIYPVKSCKGIELKKSKVLPSGLEFDRLFTFAQLRSPFPVGLDASEAEKKQHVWSFISQRQFPLLATIQVELYFPDIAKCRIQSIKSSDAFLILRFPWREEGFRGRLQWIAAKIRRGRNALPEKEIMLPVSFPSPDEVTQRGYKYEEIKICNDTVMALNMETELPRELRLYLGVSNRLGIFRVDPARLREVERGAPTIAEAGYLPVAAFQDGYPLHLLNLSSVQDFGAKVAKDDMLKALDHKRFRPNILIDGAEAYDEETWKLISFNPSPETSRREKSNFHVSCRTVRCKMPNVDQDTGYRHPVEPDRSLRKLRNVDAGAKFKGCMGMQLTPLFDDASSPESMESWVEAGMLVEVLDRGTHHYMG